MVAPLGMEQLQFDGCGEMHVKSIDDWAKFSSSEVFRTTLLSKNRLLVTHRLT